MKLFFKNLFALTRPYRVRLGLGVFFGVLAGLMEPLLVAVVTLVYHVIFGGTELPGTSKWPAWVQNWVAQFNHETAAQNFSTSGALMLLAAIPAVFVVRGVFQYLNVYLLYWVSIRSISDLRVRLFTHLMSLPASFFSSARSSELISRILSDTESLRSVLASSVVSIVKDPVTVLSMLAFLLWQQPRLTLISMLILPVCVVPIVIYGRKARRAAKSVQQNSADLTNSMMESFTGYRIVKAYNLEDAVAREFSTTANRIVSNYMRMIRAYEIPGSLLEVAGSIGVAFVLAYAFVGLKERPSGSDFLLLILAMINMYKPIKALVKLSSSLQQSAAATERVFELLATKSTLPEPAHPKPINAAGADIRFQNLTFAYAEKTVLRDIQLTVKAGSLVALVGSSGSGKTTLTNLLLRFYDPNQGSIRIGETDVRDVTTRDLRQQIAVVTQETILFNDTIRNNIALGRPGATEAEIMAAAKHANAHEFILEKPEGYDTLIGERGVALSGGQRQRLAIARAILKNAPILILDEATSSLDTESERAVQAALEQLMVGHTTICIAHRLSTIQKADLIVAMQDGQIVETGNHAELLARGGVYANLHRMQFQ